MKQIVALMLLCLQIANGQDYKSLPFWNPNLPTDQRIDDLLDRLTLEEKVYQMINHTPAIPRLGIPAYDWWNEVLHGVARTPYRVTVYPQAIAMAATWDTLSLARMADYSALEGRAVFNKATAQGRNSERYMGLTYWTPNINIFRDPRWGRGQETYGEDPFLTGTMGAAFVRSLQGNDPKYLKAAACAKHFAVHSGPEPSRHVDNFSTSNYDLWDTYLPAFKELITKANVAGVMCAYNQFRDQPCCGNDELLTDVLRKQWGFTGYLTSDCWAIDDFFKYHKTHPDAESASIDAVLHSTDIECGTDVYYSLIDAVKKGNITEAQLDVSLKRLFEIRYKLGMFDPVSMVKYAQTSDQILESKAHKDHALKMARQSMVLLKNENNTLPLSKNIKKIAVIGPNADNNIAILGNYNGIPSQRITVLDGIKNKLGKDVEVIYEKAINFTDDTLLTYIPITDHYDVDNMKGVKAEYFNNDSLAGKPTMIAYEKEIDHFWFEGESPSVQINSQRFSARYTTFFTSQTDETFHFEIGADDGYRVFVDGKEIENAWTRNRWGPRQFDLPMKKGEKKKIVVEYYQNEGNAWVRFRAGQKVKTDFEALAKRMANVDAILYVGGISPQLEGEEMKVNLPGFDGGDRTSILLPAVQTNLMKTLKGTGKPLVFVMMAGSAVAMPWESENVPAIVDAWYAGQSAGDAVADVLFGDYNPAGRLPITFYKSDADLPDFKSYDMENRTYRYFKGEPLFPFGFGLSYSTFKYSAISAKPTVKKGNQIVFKTTVTNTGKMAGEEVTQLYVSHLGQKSKAPIRALKEFTRLSLQPGESKEVTFTISADDLSLVSESGESYQPKGKVTISIGGGQPNIKNKTTSNVVTKTITIL
ncbi:MAG: glycoside hydrolase family 3 C-terminal domain-containing protein [Saprospiraceae bacterium]|nr:glycoside hydrolase family 3 C-terminal domain-containing protein [Saprospiraceae bacterium]HMS67829.1 glycoside hydrolase family 3 C-terminal domain-containing protein [Saprospiraceae bacterium]